MKQGLRLLGRGRHEVLRFLKGAGTERVRMRLVRMILNLVARATA